MGITTIFKHEVGDILLGLHLGGASEPSEYHRALAVVAMSIGLREVAEQIMGVVNVAEAEAERARSY
jgi:hypothetical protein